MAEVKPSGSPGEDAIAIVGEASCSGVHGSTSPGSVPSAIAAESPSFLTWMWIQISTACSGVWGVRGESGGYRTCGLASGAQQTQENSESEVSGRIAASKPTWSEVRGRDIDHSVSAPCPSNLSVWEELKEGDPEFFNGDWGDDLELGRLIAEGGQAQIFEFKAPWLPQSSDEEEDLVLKVFKLDSGFSLADLKCHWPRKKGVRSPTFVDLEGTIVDSEGTIVLGSSSEYVFGDVYLNMLASRCLILGATLLPDGKFAFLMRRYWGDLRTLIDLKVKQSTYPWEFDLLSQPPFSFHNSVEFMLRIATGMQILHAEGVLHRDLKAANVLISIQGLDSFYCQVADYECSMFVQGTGFWRAPEVLQELFKNEEDGNEEIWTEKVDVYSFGMTCYEILTGQIPFDGCTKSKWDDVIKCERPSLPEYVFPELRELVEACWHAQPSQRPSFDVIVEKLHSIWRVHYRSCPN